MPVVVGNVVAPAVPEFKVVCPVTARVPVIVVFPAASVPVVETFAVNVGLILEPAIAAAVFISASTIVLSNIFAEVIPPSFTLIFCIGVDVPSNSTV